MSAIMSIRTLFSFALLWLPPFQSGVDAFVHITPVRSHEDRHGNALMQNKHVSPESQLKVDDDWLIRNFNDPIEEENTRPDAAAVSLQPIPSIPVQQGEHEGNLMAELERSQNDALAVAYESVLSHGNDVAVAEARTPAYFIVGDNVVLKDSDTQKGERGEDDKESPAKSGIVQLPTSVEQEIQALRCKQEELLRTTGPREPFTVLSRIEKLQKRAQERVSQLTADIEDIQGGETPLFPSAGALAATGLLCLSTVSFATRWVLWQTHPDMLLMLESDFSMALHRASMLIEDFVHKTLASLPEDSVPVDQVRELMSSSLGFLSQAKDVQLEELNTVMVQFFASCTVWKHYASEQSMQCFDQLVGQGNSMVHLVLDSIDSVGVLTDSARESISQSALVTSEATSIYAKQSISQAQAVSEKIVVRAADAYASSSWTLSCLLETSLRVGHQTIGWCQDIADESVKQITLATHKLERPLLSAISSKSASVKETADSLLRTLDFSDVNEIITIPDIDSSSLTS